MRIFFEHTHYPLDLIQEANVPEYFCTYVEGGLSAKIEYVGYFFSLDKVNPSKSEPLFILPKIFINDIGKVFGKYKPIDLAKGEASISKINDNHLKVELFELSTWIYRAIHRYASENPTSSIVGREQRTQRVTSRKGNNSYTLIDVILSLIAFNKEHQNLITYLTITQHSGNKKIQWPKTISKVRPILQKGNPIYTEFLTKGKNINFDEQLVVIFYSVLDYLRIKYHFNVRPPLNYELIPNRQIQSMIDNGKGTRLLKSIRKKYFKDEFVALWDLLYVFFEKSESIAAKKYKDEALLAKDFNIIFEAMIDDLLSDDDIPSGLKKQKDGKEIDHIYKGESLIPSSSIYYIGDSKYYLASNDVSQNSISKQFTYAKNVIQECINMQNEGIDMGDLMYRDNLTEGYNITPNFFIRGTYNEEKCKFDYTNSHFESIGKEFRNIHFENRPFDRDTLWVVSFNINFLYALSSYASGGASTNDKRDLKSIIKQRMIEVFNEKYDFYQVIPNNFQDFIQLHKQEFYGKMLADKSKNIIWFAFEKGHEIDLSNLLGALESHKVRLSL